MTDRMQVLVEDFLQYLRHERGQAEHTQKTYAGILKQFVTWAEKQKLTDWNQVELKHLMGFLAHERGRPLAHQPKESARRLSNESVYLEIAALRAFFRFAENEKLLPAAKAGLAENLSGAAVIVGEGAIEETRKCDGAVSCAGDRDVNRFGG